MRNDFIINRRELLKLTGFISLGLVTPSCTMAFSKSKKGDGKKALFRSQLAIGECLALEGFRKYGKPVDNPEIQKYVSLLGNSLLKNTTQKGKALPYYFVVTNSPQKYSFGYPGGIIIISSGLFKFLKSESELSLMVAREIGHIRKRHAINSIDRKILTSQGKQKGKKSKKKKGPSPSEKLIAALNEVIFVKGY